MNEVTFQDQAISCAGRGRPQIVPRAQALLQTRKDIQLATMYRAYSRSGGLCTGDELALRLRVHSAQPISLLARWIVSREVISFQLHLQTMLPLFQFDLAEMVVRPEVSAIIGELSGVFDDWDLALWFAEPNVWLDDRAPIEVCVFDARAALHAARADRFVANG